MFLTAEKEMTFRMESLGRHLENVTIVPPYLESIEKKTVRSFLNEYAKYEAQGGTIKLERLMRPAVEKLVTANYISVISSNLKVGCLVPFCCNFQ